MGWVVGLVNLSRNPPRDTTTIGIVGFRIREGFAVELACPSLEGIILNAPFIIPSIPCDCWTTRVDYLREPPHLRNMRALTALSS